MITDPLWLEIDLLIVLGLIVLVVGRILFRSAASADTRLLKLCAGDVQPLSSPRALRPTDDRRAAWILDTVPVLMPRWIIGKYRERLVRAGMRGNGAAATFFGAKLILTVALPAASWAVPALLLSLSLPVVVQLGAAVSAGAIGFVIPDLVVIRRMRRRLDRLESELPYALDLLVTLCEAGLGLDAAFVKLLEGKALATGPFREELSIVVGEIRHGKERSAALRGLANRTGIEEVGALVVALVQGEQLGSGVGQVLRVQADSLRARRQGEAEEKATKLPIKLIMPLVFCIFPGIFVVTLVPALLRILGMMSDALGNYGGR